MREGRQSSVPSVPGGSNTEQAGRRQREGVQRILPHLPIDPNYSMLNAQTMSVVQHGNVNDLREILERWKRLGDPTVQSVIDTLSDLIKSQEES